MDWKPADLHMASSRESTNKLVPSIGALVAIRVIDKSLYSLNFVHGEHFIDKVFNRFSYR